MSIDDGDELRARARNGAGESERAELQWNATERNATAQLQG
jgi:hypothetical protein